VTAAGWISNFVNFFFFWVWYKISYFKHQNIFSELKSFYWHQDLEKFSTFFRNSHINHAISFILIGLPSQIFFNLETSSFQVCNILVHKALITLQLFLQVQTDSPNAKVRVF
jgi:hypothetical protein